MSIPPPTTPAGWYPDPSGAPGQRYFDGTRWTDHRTVASAPPPFVTNAEQNKPGRRKIIAGVAGGILALAVIGSLTSHDEPAPAISTVESSAQAAAVEHADLQPAAAPTEVVAAAGSAVRDGKFEFVVTSTDTSTVGGNPNNQFMQETAQGKYLNVHLRVTNIGNEAQTFFSSNQKLHAGGREYDADSMVGMWNGAENVEVNPGNSIDAVVSFDVPVDLATADTLELHDSAFSGGAQLALG